MEGNFSIGVDARALREALGAPLTALIRQRVRSAARVSAEHVRDEAARRLQRQLLGGSTGETLAGIVVRANRSGWGWTVRAANARMPMLPGWIDAGTKKGKPGSHTAAPRPFFWASARLEESPHRARIATAIQEAIAEGGLGETQAAPHLSAGGVGLL